MVSGRWAAGVAVVAALLSGCAGPAAHPGIRPAAAPRAAGSTPPTTAATVAATPVGTTPRRAAALPRTPVSAARRVPGGAAVGATTSSGAGRSLLVDRLSGVGDAGQVISVTNDGYGSTYATLQAFTRTASGWQLSFGPWQARIGYNGFAPAGDKREGDGRTPTGSYGLQFMFGVEPDPGVRFSYRRVTGSYVVWDDDPSSVSYNLWVDTRTQNPGRDPEPMYRLPAYAYGAVIAYNTRRTPGLGSAIFLHVTHSGPTAGCVSVPQADLLPLLRWLDPARSPRIIMGPTSAVTT